MRKVDIQNKTNPLNTPLQVGYANSYWDRLKGLMFTKPVTPDQGLLLVQGRESRVDASIHMFFVSYDLGTVWLDNHGQVVDSCLARSWRPFYAPTRPARYVLEINPTRLAEFHPGDHIHFEALPRG